MISLHISVIGDWMATGVQFAFLRLQQAAMGQGSLTILQDIGEATRGGVPRMHPAASILIREGAVAAPVGTPFLARFRVVAVPGERQNDL